VLLAFGGPLAYTLLLDNPFLRRTGLPAWVLFVPALILALAAFRDPRWRARIPAVAALAVAGFFTWAFYFMMVVPAPPQATWLASNVAEDFTLPDHTGQPVSLRQAHDNGPVLLVFYRGHW
jgi:hypothetical protein